MKYLSLQALPLRTTWPGVAPEASFIPEKSIPDVFFSFFLVLRPFFFSQNYASVIFSFS